MADLQAIEAAERSVWTDVCRAIERAILVHRAAVASDTLCARPTPWSGFAASFWAPEVLLFGNLYRMHYTRDRIDRRLSNLIEAASAGPLIWDALTQRSVDTGKPAFWSPVVTRTTSGGILLGLICMSYFLCG